MVEGPAAAARGVDLTASPGHEPRRGPLARHRTTRAPAPTPPRAPVRRLAATALAAALLVGPTTACSTLTSVHDTSADVAGGAAADEAADIAYLRRMVRFERQSADLAAIALARSTDPTVRSLAQTASEESRQALTSVERALGALGVDPPPADRGVDADWDGLLTDRQLAALRTGDDVDRLWASAVILVDREALTVSTDRLHDDHPVVTDIAAASVSRCTREYTAASRYLGASTNRVPLPR